MMLTMTKEQYEAHQARVKGARTVSPMSEPAVVKPARKPAKRAPPLPVVEKAPRKKWSYEERLAQQLEEAGISGFYVDAEYLPNRQVRADLLFMRERLVVEVQGHVHRIKAKWLADIYKAQDTMLGGYRLLPVSTAQVRDGSAVEIVRKALALAEWVTM